MALTSLATSKPVRTPDFILTYSGVNITADISDQAIDILFEDTDDGVCPTVTCKLEDRFKRWQGPWYPGKGDTLNLKIGYKNEALLDCGDFILDELNLSGPPDVFTIKGIGASIDTPLRSTQSHAYEHVTSYQVAGFVAAKHGLTLLGEYDPTTDPARDRISQKDESDLDFLQKLASENGYLFTVHGLFLVFTSQLLLDAVASAFSIDRTRHKTFNFTDKTRGTYRESTVMYFDPKTKSLLSGTATPGSGFAATAPASGASPGTVPGPSTVATATVLATSAAGGDLTPALIPSNDAMLCATRVENAAQAKAKAVAAIDLRDRDLIEMKNTIIGDQRAAAGLNIDVHGFGRMSGKYHLTATRHRISRAGYLTELEGRRVIS